MTNTTPVPALAMRGLVKTFGPTRALDNATLEVEPGAVHGLVGQNGAGKSTLIKVLTGFHRGDAGATKGAPHWVSLTCEPPGVLGGG